MKNNFFFLLTLFTLLIIILGILFYQYQAKQINLALHPQSEELLDQEKEDTANVSTPSSTENLFIQQAPISDQTDLKTIQQELQDTVIFEEEFADL
ncbi:MAG TPA: hypothetical protein PLM16_00290 [Candidatus Woesebacteria bacterium]|nr:hypothetical protein [Candidatus Woesebacteria bacterium]